MTKYHIASNGEPAVCNAEERACPLGGEHYGSMEEALTKTFDKRMQQVSEGTLKRPLQDKTPSQIDEQLAAIYYRESRVRGDIHQAVQDLERYEERLAKAKASDRPYDQRYVEAYEKDVAYGNKKIEGLRADLAKIEAERGPGEAEYDFRGGWTRAFLAQSKPGHVHRSMNCPSCNKGKQSTRFAWLTEYSGKNEEEIVSDAGEHACTYCYPSAPVEVLNRPSKIKWESEEQKARREKKEAADKVKAEKGITNPDGSDVLIKSTPSSNYGFHVKSAVGAEREALETLEQIENSKTSQGVSGTDAYKELYASNYQKLRTALAFKRNETEEQTENWLQERYEAKKKRDAKRRY